MKTAANKITIARIVLLPIPGYLLYLEGGSHAYTFLVLGVILVLGVTDWVDGIIARREGTTVLGGLLDPIADKIFIAVIYLPLTERGIIPLWMTACIFARDFLVTSLRTSLLLRDAPMRTSTLAKFKTAIQMVGVGYVILYHYSPEAWFVLPLISAPILFPLGVIFYRLAKKKKQGQRSWIMLVLLLLGIAIYQIFGIRLATDLTLWIITGITVVSGLSYLADAWSALKGKPGSIKETGRFALDGLVVPIVLLTLLGRYGTTGMSTAVILAITLELAGGGLGNFLASEKIAPRFRLIAAKSMLLVVLASVALTIWWYQIDFGLPVGEICVLAILAGSFTFAVAGFWRHRRVYLNVI